jgi:hypothetical protein
MPTRKGIDKLQGRSLFNPRLCRFPPAFAGGRTSSDKLTEFHSHGINREIAAGKIRLDILGKRREIEMPLSTTWFQISCRLCWLLFFYYDYSSYDIDIVEEYEFAPYFFGYSAGYVCGIASYSNIYIVGLSLQKPVTNEATYDVTLLLLSS